MKTKNNSAKSTQKESTKAAEGRKVTNNQTTKGGKGRNNAADQLSREEVIQSSGRKDVKQLLTAAFAVPEWAGASVLRASLDALLSAGTINAEQYESMMTTAAKNAGVPVPICSLPRLLAVARRYRSELQSIGINFDNLLTYYRGRGGSGVVGFSWRLSRSLVRSNSVLSDFLEVHPVTGTVGQMVTGFLSFSVFELFQSAKATATNEDKNDLQALLAAAYRIGVRLGYSVDDVASKLADVAAVTSEDDTKTRNRLNKNLSSCREKLAAVDAEILSLLPSLGADGVVTAVSLPADGVPAKIRRKLWPERSRRLSAIDTLSRLLS